MNRAQWRSSDVRRKTDAPTSGMRGAAGLFAATLLLAACGGGGDDKASPTRDEGADQRALTSTTVAPGASVPAPPDGQAAAAVEAAYREAWTAFIAYNSETGPFDPADFKQRVGRFFIDAAYDAIFKTSQESRLRGEVFSPAGVQPGELAPKVSVEAPTRASVRDCSPDHATVKASTGERLDRPLEGREDSTVVMTLDEGQWRIADILNTNRPCTV